MNESILINHRSSEYIILRQIINRATLRSAKHFLVALQPMKTTNNKGSKKVKPPEALAAVRTVEILLPRA